MIFDTENCKCYSCNFTFGKYIEDSSYFCECSYTFISIIKEFYDSSNQSLEYYIMGKGQNMIRVDAKDFKINFTLNDSFNKVNDFSLYIRNINQIRHINAIKDSINRIKEKEYDKFSNLYNDAHKEYYRVIDNLVFL